MLHFFHNFKISCKGNKKHSNNQIKIERYDAHFNLMFIIYTCDVFNRLNAIPPHASLQFPSRPEGAEALYGDLNMINKPKKIGEKMM